MKILLGRIYMLCLCLYAYKIYSKYFQNTDVYTNINLVIWLLGSTIPCDLPGLQLFALSVFWEVNLG